MKLVIKRSLKFSFENKILQLVLKRVVKKKRKKKKKKNGIIEHFSKGISFLIKYQTCDS